MLVLSPATVSEPIEVTEIVVLAVRLAVVLTANALILRSRLAPWISWPRQCGEPIRPSEAPACTTEALATYIT